MNVTSHAEAFLEDIAAHPDDDAPRLIFADWLDDHGDADRAEVIRLQCWSDKLPPGDSRRLAMQKRVDALLNLHRAKWRAALPRLEGVTWEDFSRGFVDAVFVETVEAFLQQAPLIFAATPIRRVQVGRIDTDAVWHLCRSPCLARLSELNLGNNPNLSLADVACLADSPHLGGLSVLLVHYCDLGDDCAVRLAGSSCLGGLVELYLSGNDLSDPAAVALGRAKGFPRLADLDLRDNRINDWGIMTLAHEGQRQALETLWLTNNVIGPDGAEALAFSTALPRLRQLYVNYNPLDNDGAIAFAESPHRTALRDLDLRNAQIGDRGGRALAHSVHLNEAEGLWLGGNRLDWETLRLLRRRYGQRVRI